MTVRDFSIGLRLGAIMALILMVATVLLTISLFSDVRNRTKINAATHLANSQIELANSMQQSLMRSALAVLTIGLQTDVAGVDAAVAEAKKERARFDQTRKVVEATKLSDEDKKILAELDNIESQNLKYFGDAVGLAQQFNADDAAALISKKIQPLNKLSAESLDKFIALQKSHADSELQVVDGDAAHVLMTTAMIGLLALIFSAAATWLLVRSIALPMKQAVDFTRQVTAGNLGAHIQIEGKDETAQLLSSLQSMQASLVQVVGRVRDGSEAVTSASAEIAAGNNDLSARTEQQAGALEQTSASMEELSSTVKENAESARQASQLAQSE